MTMPIHPSIMGVESAICFFRSKSLRNLNKTKSNIKYNLLHGHILFIFRIVNSQYIIKRHSNQQYTCFIGGQFY